MSAKSAKLRRSTRTDSTKARALKVNVPGVGRVSALLRVPASAWAAYVLAHGAGAGMRHWFMDAIAEGLAARGIATLRFQFPYLERGGRRPDSPPVAHATIRAAVVTAAQRLPTLPLFAGGRSYGGRMASQAQALTPLPGIRGLVFIGFPLHPAGAPATQRADHLFDVRVPLLFLQGTRDALADLKRLRPLCRKLGRRATLALFPEADHSFHVPARSGQTDDEIREGLLDRVAEWMQREIRR